MPQILRNETTMELRTIIKYPFWPLTTFNSDWRRVLVMVLHHSSTGTTSCGLNRKHSIWAAQKAWRANHMTFKSIWSSLRGGFWEAEMSWSGPVFFGWALSPVAILCREQNAKKYCETLQNHLLLFIVEHHWDGCLFMKDGTSKHIATVTMLWLQEYSMSVLKLVPRSYDLNT